MLLVTLVSWSLSMYAVYRTQRRYRIVCRSGQNGIRLAYAAGAREHEVSRLGQQSVLVAVSVYCIARTPIILSTESIVLRVCLMTISAWMALTTMRSLQRHAYLIHLSQLKGGDSGIHLESEQVEATTKNQRNRHPPHRFDEH